MEFFDKLLEDFGVPKPSEMRYKIVINGEACGCFSFVTGIVKYSADEIILSVKGGKLTVSGENLTIGKYVEGDVLICGKITGIVKN